MSSVFNYLHIKNDCLGEAWAQTLRKLRAHNTNANERAKIALQLVLRDCAKSIVVNQNSNDNASYRNLDEGKLNRLITAIESGEVSEESIRACEVGKADDPHKERSDIANDPESSSDVADKQGTEVH